MHKKIVGKVFKFNIIAPACIVIALLVTFNLTEAANMSETVLRINRMATSTATGGTVCAKPATVATEASVDVTFPTSFAVNTTAANWTITTSDLPLGATAWVGIGTATAAVGKTVTFPSGDLVVGTLYCFNFVGTNTLTTGTAGVDQVGSVVTNTVAPAVIDSGSYATSVISNDQIIITATVPPIFSLALGGNTDSFTANLSTTTVSTTGNTATVATNANNGWVTWVKSANAGLNSAVTGASIATAGSIDATPTDLASTTGYVLDTNLTTDSAVGTGTVTINAEYNGANTTSGGTLSAIFQPIASGSGTTDGDVMTLIERAKVTAVQPAASDYTDTLTVVAAGLF